MCACVCVPSIVKKINREADALYLYTENLHKAEFFAQTRIPVCEYKIDFREIDKKKKYSSPPHYITGLFEIVMQSRFDLN